MRKSFHTKKIVKSGSCLEPGPKWARFIFSNFLLHKNLDKKILKKKSLLMKGKKGVNFLMKTDSKHQ